MALEWLQNSIFENLSKRSFFANPVTYSLLCCTVKSSNLTKIYGYHYNLYRSFCESYDMQEHSSKIFGDIIDGLGGFIQSNLTSQMIHSSLMAITSSSSPPTGVTNNSSGHLTSGGVAGGHPMHMFTIKNMTLHAEFLPANSHNKPAL